MTCRFADININLRTEPSGIIDMRRIKYENRENKIKLFIFYFLLIIT